MSPHLVSHRIASHRASKTRGKHNLKPNKSHRRYPYSSDTENLFPTSQTRNCVDSVKPCTTIAQSRERKRAISASCTTYLPTYLPINKRLANRPQPAYNQVNLTSLPFLLPIHTPCPALHGSDLSIIIAHHSLVLCRIRRLLTGKNSLLAGESRCSCYRLIRYLPTYLQGRWKENSTKRKGKEREEKESKWSANMAV